MASPTALDSAIAKSSQLSKIIWASSSSTHFAVKQIVSYSARLNRSLICLRPHPAAKNASLSAVATCDRKLDECARFIDECISFRRDSVVTPDDAALDADRNAFPTGRALLLSGELLMRVEQVEALLRDHGIDGRTDFGPSASPAHPRGTPAPAPVESHAPEMRRAFTATAVSLPLRHDAANASSVPAFSMTDDYQQGVDVRGRYHLKRKFDVSRNRAPAHYSPEVVVQATPSIMPSSLGSTCSPSPAISALTSSPSLQQSSMTSITSSKRAPCTTTLFHKKLPSLSLGPASLPAHVAVLRLYTKEATDLPRDLQLLAWRKSIHPDGSVITWSIQGSDEEFVHYLPTNAFPLTLHKDHNEGTVIQFNALHKVALRSENHERFFSSTRVVYEFVQNEPFICFQEDIRHKHLVDVFDFHLILSSRSGSSTYGEAIHGHVKFWRDREPPFHHSISFFGNHAGKDLEFPILRFNAQTVPRRLEKRVKLSFTLPGKGSQNKGSFRGFFKRSSQSSEVSTPVAGHPSNISQPTRQLATLMSDLKYLDFRFDAVEDFDRFIKSFQEIRAADEARSTFSFADISAELENTLVTGELPADREKAELEMLLLTSPTIPPRAESEAISPATSPITQPQLGAMAGCLRI